jgi:hypothetical protein
MYGKYELSVYVTVVSSYGVASWHPGRLGMVEAHAFLVTYLQPLMSASTSMSMFTLPLNEFKL